MIEKKEIGNAPGEVEDQIAGGVPVEVPVYYKDSENPNRPRAMTLFYQCGLSGELADLIRRDAARNGKTPSQYVQDWLAKRIMPHLTELVRTLEQIEAAEAQGGGGSHTG